MATEGTSFENPAFDPEVWDDDDDDDESKDADETTPFIPDSASTPGPSGEDIPKQTMQNEKSGVRPETSYAETSFTGAQSLSEQAWIAAKDLFSDMSSSELEVSYSSKGKLQVKIFGAGKKTYDLFTKNKSTGRYQINPNLSKKIKKALGDSNYEREQQTIYEKRKELKEKQYEEREKTKKKWIK